MSSHYRLVFKLPNRVENLYFRCEKDVFDKGQHISVPELTPNVGEAHRFIAASSVAFRDRYRGQYSRDGYDIFIQDVTSGATVFDSSRDDVASTGEDQRKSLFVSPDDLEASGLGFIVRPAVRPSQGQCWAVCPRDIPSLAEFTELETVYATDPLAAVEKARHAWGVRKLPVVPIPSPLATRVAEEVERPTFQGRRRPGDI